MGCINLFHIKEKQGIVFAWLPIDDVWLTSELFGLHMRSNELMLQIFLTEDINNSIYERRWMNVEYIQQLA